MKPLDITLDTNILSRDRKLSGKNILLLKKLSQLKLITLHIPWVVYKEFTTQNISEISVEINNALKSIRSIFRMSLTDSDQSELDYSYTAILSIKDKIAQSVEKNWNAFIVESKAIIYEIEDSHGKSVMNSYFNASKPFSSSKNRNDIPDAFVFESVSSIVNSNNIVIFISEDKRLRKSFTEFPNIKTFESLDHFFNSDIFKTVDTEYKKKEHYADELIELEKYINIIQDVANVKSKEFLDSLINTDIQNKNIPSDNNDGTIVHIENIKPVSIDKDNIKFINNSFYLKVLVIGSLRIEYFLFKWDEYMIEDRNNADIVDNDWNDHYYVVSESYDFEFSYDFSISKDNVGIIEELYNNGSLLVFLEIDKGSASFDNLIIT